MKLSETGLNRSHNLQLMRFFAAIGVICAHAFPIATGSSTKEWLTVLTNGQITLGGLAVSIFFLCGGYLTGKSIERKDGRYFFRARIVRLVPALAFVNICMVLAGVLLTTCSPAEYVMNKDTWKYLLNSVFILVHDLPGVFTENIYLPTVNGSLWTLPVEFLCYIACFLLYRMTGWKKKIFKFTIPLALPFVLAFFLLPALSGLLTLLQSVIRPVLLFYIWICFWIYRESITIRKSFVFFALAAFVCTVYLGLMDVGMILFFPYIMFSIWFAKTQCPEKYSFSGDYSYSIYLWGFPVQQTVTFLFGGSMDPYVNMLIAIPVSVGLGILAFYVVERPCIKMLDKR